MHERPLLLSAANHTHSHKKPKAAWRIALAAFGVFVVLYGAADAMSRVADMAHLSPALIFGPVITAVPEATPALATSATSTTPIVPTRLTIPSIGVNAVVESVGKKADGSMGTPSNFDDVAWYALGPKPGDAGSAVIDGHVNNALTKPGVFEHLSQVAIGDTLTLTDVSGQTRTFIVDNIEEISADEAPPASLFATTGSSQVVLITCDGDWVPAEKTFDKRLVVFAGLAK